MKVFIAFAIALLLSTQINAQMVKWDTARNVVFGTAEYAVRWVSVDTIIRTRDTVPAIVLISDTSNVWYFGHDTLVFDKTDEVRWRKAYSVREKHNEAEGNIDWYIDHCFPGCPPKDYWVHLYYLDEKKRPFSKTIVIWQGH